MRFYIFEGNNSQIIGEQLKRQGFREVRGKEEGLKVSNFIWKPVKLNKRDFEIV